MAHENIIKTHELFINKDTERLYMVMELCFYPSLKTKLTKSGKINEKDAQIVIWKIIQAVKYLHNKGICHRDLKPDNIMIKDDFTVLKIIDFGIARKFI